MPQRRFHSAPKPVHQSVGLLLCVVLGIPDARIAILVAFICGRWVFYRVFMLVVFEPAVLPDGAA